MTSNKKHIIAYSGGHSSALVAIEVVRRFGKDNVILLNHDISSKVENEDIKRFKREVADYLGLPITYANHSEHEEKTPIDVCVDMGTWVNPSNRAILCTYKLKTEPFYSWLKANYNEGDICYYGFDANEQHRITRRNAFMSKDGYKTDYPLALWSERTIQSTTEISINPPNSYTLFNHANCTGCLKAGWQHWYIIYVHHRHIWEQLKTAEEQIGYSVHNSGFAEDKEQMFDDMLAVGVEPTEKIPSGKFWADVRRLLKAKQSGQITLFDIPVVERSVECTGDCKL